MRAAQNMYNTSEFCHLFLPTFPFIGGKNTKKHHSIPDIFYIIKVEIPGAKLELNP